MSREIPNEIEERRVMRLLAGAAEAIPPLREAELETLLGTPPALPLARTPRRLPRVPHLISAGAVAAAVALAVVLPLHRQAPAPQQGSPPALAVFPEGNALSLLLSRKSEGRA